MRMLRSATMLDGVVGFASKLIDHSTDGVEPCARMASGYDFNAVACCFRAVVKDSGGTVKVMPSIIPRSMMLESSPCAGSASKATTVMLRRAGRSSSRLLEKRHVLFWGELEAVRSLISKFSIEKLQKSAIRAPNTVPDRTESE